VSQNVAKPAEKMSLNKSKTHRIFIPNPTLYFEKSNTILKRNISVGNGTWLVHMKLDAMTLQSENATVNRAAL
jgi:hypothetical protein